MKKFLRFIAIGTAFSTTEEFLTVAVLRHDPASYVFTLVILFPVLLGFVYFSSKLLDKLFNDNPRRELAHFLCYGLLGLMFEWFLMGHSPWSNPAANPFGMAIFQLGMFSFWSTVTFAPRLFLSPDSLSKATRKQALWFSIPYLILTYAVGLTVPGPMRFVTIICLIIFGFLVLNTLFVKYFVRAFQAQVAARTVALTSDQPNDLPGSSLPIP